MTKILVIDDDIAINELIKINLELQGYEVKQAFNVILKIEKCLKIFAIFLAML